MTDFIEEVSDEIHDMAVMAEAAYLRTENAKQNSLTKQNVNYTLLPEYSDKFSSVFKKDNHLVFSIKGTDITNSTGTRLSDLKDDLLIGLGMERATGQYKKAKKKFEKLRNDFKDHEISLTGHSLGGNVVKNLHFEKADEIKESHIFNPGATHHHVRSRGILSLHPKNKKNAEKLHSYTTSSDPISFSSLFDPLATNHIVKTKSGINNVHSMNHFIKQKPRHSRTAERRTKPQSRKVRIS